MGVLGGRLKFMERLSARLGDVLSQLYIASAVLRFYIEGSKSNAERAHARWALDNCLYEIGRAFDGFIHNFPAAWARGLLRLVVFPLGNRFAPVSDRVNARVADLLLEATDVRERLSWLVYRSGGEHDPIGRMEKAWKIGLKTEPAYLKYYKLSNKGEIGGDTVAERLDDAIRRGLLSRDEAAQASAYDDARYDVILTDDFSKDYLAGHFGAERARDIEQAGELSRVA
jgi:acyl-CoA dehydrogenase